MSAKIWRLTAIAAAVLAAVPVVACLVGCSAAPPPAAVPRPLPGEAAPATIGPTLQDREWGVLRSQDLGLKLALPEGKAWLTPATRGPEGASWELHHQPTGSTLSVRRWRASRLPRIDSCEAELRQRTPGLAVPDETNLVAEREVHVPAGFTTRITLVALPGQGARFQGQALAVGAGVGECLAAIARTECSTESELAERLRLLDVALGHFRLARIEDRVHMPAAGSQQSSQPDPPRP